MVPKSDDQTAAEVVDVGEPQSRFHPLLNDEDAEIILSSNDDMLFRLPRFTLKKASRYFHDLFSKSKEELSSAGGVKDQEHPSCSPYQIPFPREPLEYVLLMISALPTTPLQNLDKAEEVINVMQFLDVEGPLNVLRYHILPQFNDQPLRVYELGTKLGWREVIQRGAELTLSLNLFSNTPPLTDPCDPQLSRLSCPALVDLLDLHQRRRLEFRQKLRAVDTGVLGGRYACCVLIWKRLTNRLVEELEWDCSGARILSLQIEDWEESNACWANGTGSCGHMFRKAASLMVIRGILNGLSKSVFDKSLQQVTDI